MHYNIQIHIQQVQEPEQIGTANIGSKPIMSERKVTPVLELKVTANTEAGAYERALKVLNMNAPQPPYVMLQQQLVPECHSEHGAGHSTCPKCWRP